MKPRGMARNHTHPRVFVDSKTGNVRQYKNSSATFLTFFSSFKGLRCGDLLVLCVSWIFAYVLCPVTT